jgi:flagellar FliL protein
MAEDLDEEYDEEPEESGGEGGGKKKMLLLIVLPVLLLIGAVAGAYFAGLMDPLLGKGDDGGHEPAAAEHAPAAAPGGEHQEGGPMQVQAAVFYDLPEMLVDLNAQGRKRTFLKLRVSLELSSQTDILVVESVMPRIIDNFQVYLRELRLEDLQGAEGIYRLREELLVRVNQAVRPAKVNDVLFKEMLIQ